MNILLLLILENNKISSKAVFEEQMDPLHFPIPASLISGKYIKKHVYALTTQWFNLLTGLFSIKTVLLSLAPSTITS